MSVSRPRRLPRVAPPSAAPGLPIPKTTLEQVQWFYEQTLVPVRKIASAYDVSERCIYRAAERRKWKPRGISLTRSRGTRALSDAAAAEVAEAARRRAVEHEAERIAAARSKAQHAAEREARKRERAQEETMQTLLIIAKMQLAGGAAMRAELDVTLAKVYSLFDARLAAAERAAEGADATDAERHIVRALRQLREAPPQARKREGGDNLSEEEQRKELERSLTNLIAGSRPSSPASSPDRPEGPSSSDPDSYGRAVPALSGSPGQARR